MSNEPMKYPSTESNVQYGATSTISYAEYFHILRRVEVVFYVPLVMVIPKCRCDARSLSPLLSRIASHPGEWV